MPKFIDVNPEDGITITLNVNYIIAIEETDNGCEITIAASDSSGANRVITVNDEHHVIIEAMYNDEGKID